jgi:hypothetical protein
MLFALNSSPVSNFASGLWGQRHNIDTRCLLLLKFSRRRHQIHTKTAEAARRGNKRECAWHTIKNWPSAQLHRKQQHPFVAVRCALLKYGDERRRRADGTVHWEMINFCTHCTVTCKYDYWAATCSKLLFCVGIIIVDCTV